MARFYGTVQGQRGEASRLGGAASGLRTTCNGWRLGATCLMKSITIDGADIDQLSVSVNEGSDRTHADYGGFTVRQIGEKVQILPDAVFLANCPAPYIASRLAQIEDPAIIEWAGGLLLQSEKWSKWFTAQLWIQGKVKPDETSAA